jgi:hypothetical protein
MGYLAALKFLIDIAASLLRLHREWRERDRSCPPPQPDNEKGLSPLDENPSS